MIKLYFSATGLRRIVLDAPSAPGREFDLAALIAIRPHLLAADRVLIQLAPEVLAKKLGKRDETENSGFSHIGDIIRDVVKEIYRRDELRPRLEAEIGRTLTDQEFIEHAEKTGPKI